MLARALPPDIAIVLPYREAFSANASGALGLLARRHACWPGLFRATVFGPPPPGPPFPAVPFHAVTPDIWPAPKVWRYGRGVLRALRRSPPALVEVHNRPDLALFLAARLGATPVTLILNNDPQGMRRAATQAERRRLLGALACVATCSAFVRERLLDGIPDPPAQPIILPNCLDLRELPPLAEIRDNVILFAGRVVADKGADAFVEACAAALPALPGWRAEMIGGDRFGPDNPQTPFLRALCPRAAAAGVVMHGYRPHAEVLAAMARAAVVVVPSRWSEPFGLTALEAMACGAALLCSNRGGLADVVGDAGEIIDPDDPAGFAATLVRVGRDAPHRAALARAGRARASRFDMTAIGPALDAFRAGALARFSRSPRNPI